MTCKIVPDMTYNVFGVTLNPTQSVGQMFDLNDCSLTKQTFSAQVSKKTCNVSPVIIVHTNERNT